MSTSATILGTFSPQIFVAEYFQKRSLFLPGALAHTTFPLSPDQLLGLASEEGVESRLVENTRFDGPVGRAPFALREGPFTQADFRALGQRDWTLLVQDVDKWIPEVARLLHLVRFLPSWSVDDIMVSFAKPGGSVGPHTDQYDVFLVQAQGTRRWELSRNVNPEDLRSDTDLKVLRHFEAEETHVARPGDVLYLPPGVAHHGVAEDDCLTFSFGFRAPGEATLLSFFADEMVTQASQELLREELTGPTSAPAELSAALVERAREIVHQAFHKSVDDMRWFGRALTEPKPNLPGMGEGTLSPRQVESLLSAGGKCRRSTASRFLFLDAGDCVVLFVDGEDFSLAEFPRPRKLALLLCEADPLSLSELGEIVGRGRETQLAVLLGELAERGALAPYEGPLERP